MDWRKIELIEEKKLMEFKDDVHHCAKCHLCKNIDSHHIINENFADICPSGSNFKFESYFSSGKMEIVRALLNNEIKVTPKLLEIVYTCTLCGGCESICNVQKDMKPTEVFQALRNWLKQKGYGPLEGHIEIKDNVLHSGNPWGYPKKDRINWASEFKIDPITDETEIIFFVGSFISYDKDAQKIAQNIVKIFQKIGIKFGILGEEEQCCGSTVLLTGDIDAFKTIYEKNLELFKKYNKPIVVSCSGCYNMLKNVYELDKFGIKVSHISEYLYKLTSNRRLIFTKDLNMNITYHDPCHLGRHSGIYKQPRKLIEKINGLNLIEMDRNMENSYCCGAGGGVKKTYPDYALTVANQRIDEAISTGAEALFTACPFCERNFRDTGRMKVYDLTDLVLMAL